MNKRSYWSAVLLAAATGLGAADFAVQTDGQGGFQVRYHDEVVVDSIRTTVSADPASEKRRYETRTLPDGTVVHNVWSEESERKFRTEVALAGDRQSVEITFMTECGAYSETVSSGKTLEVKVPLAAFENGSFAGYAGRATADKKLSGKLTGLADRARLGGDDWRYLALDDGRGKKLVFDFNPIGAGDFISIYREGAIRGVWPVLGDKDHLRMLGGTMFQRETGGFIGAKLRISSGDFQKYDRDHALRKFMYTQALEPEKLLSFGAVRKGGFYQAADTGGFDPARGFGWSAGKSLRNLPGKNPGAYYSNVSGTDGVFKLSGLRSGVWLMTVGIGNDNGLENRFSVQCNGQVMGEALTVNPREAMILTLPLWVDKSGTVEFQLNGNFLISTLGAQFLLSEAEDFSFRRGPWVSEGFEPGSIFRNADYRPAPAFAVAVERFALPEPGRESAAPRRQPELPVQNLGADNAGAAWRYTASIGNCLGNSATLTELDDPGALEKFFSAQREQAVNTLIVSGLHSRHTYFRHQARGRAAVRRIAARAHQDNIKVIEHYDATLLWNLDGGFRVLTERLPEVTRSLKTQLPGFQFCIMNPAFTRACVDGVLEQVRGGVDGFMIDEVQFFPDCCSCAYCRKQFQQDTGWQLPVNELDGFFDDKKITPLKQAWQKWRKEQVGNWFVALRREIDKINPDVTLMLYTTHYGFVDRWAPLAQGTDFFESARGADFFGTEIMTRNALRSARTLPGYRKAKNLLRTAYGTPVWGLVTHQPDWNGTYFGWAINNMNAQIAWLNPANKATGRRDFLYFKQDNMDFSKARPLADVALLFSSASRDYSPTGGLRGELFGTAQTLDMLHTPYGIIGEMSLKPEVLDSYKVLIAAGAGCLSDREVLAIKDFAQRGGTVLLTYNTGMYDENGSPRSPWRFADVFGNELAGGKFRTVKSLPDLDGRIVNVGCTLSARGDLGTRLLSEKAFGKGKMIYLNLALASNLYAEEGTPGRVWQFNPDPEVDRIYREVLTRITENARIWTVQAPELVLTTLYRQDQQLLVHFLNATACSNVRGKPMSGALPEPPFPQLAEDIVFEISDGPWQSAYAVSPDFKGRKPLKLTHEGNRCRITLPKELLVAYTIVYIQ